MAEDIAVARRSFLRITAGATAAVAVSGALPRSI